MTKRLMFIILFFLFNMLGILEGSLARSSRAVAYAQTVSDTLVVLPLDEGTGTVAGNVSGSGNDGTLVNGAAFEADSGDGSPFSVRFDGVDDRIDLGALDVSGSGLTLASWFKADSFPGRAMDPRLISKASSTAANGHVFMLSTIRAGSTVRLRARVRIGGTTTTLIASGGDLQTGVWQHAATTYDGTTLRLFLDGVEVGSTPLSGAVDVDPTLPVAVGNQPAGAGNRSFDGLLDDVRILQRALSPAEIAAIVAVNSPPVAADDPYQMDEDTALVVDAAIGVLVNDSDPEMQPLQVVLESGVSDGLLNLNADGSFDYTPNPNFNGEDRFTYRASDGAANSSPATVTLTVNPLNDAPVALDDGYQASPETPLLVDAASGVLANDSDVDLDALQAVLDTDVANGVLNLNPDGSFDYTPNAGFSGQDSFTYYVSDTLLDSNLATVTLVVEAPPVAADDGYSTDEDMTLVVAAATGVLANDVDNKSPEDLSAVLTGDVSDGVLNLNADGSFDYTPDPNFNGQDSFSYEAVDGQSGATSSSAIVTLTVNPLNDAPVAVDDGYQASPETPLLVDAASGVLANDSDVDLDALQAVLDTGVANGVLDLNPDGSFDYTPNAGFSGQDSFTYYASDTLLDSNLATVTISVGGGDNSAPQIVSGEIAFTKQVIGTGLDETHMVVAADFNKDGFVDAAATDYIDGAIFLYENDGNGAFQTRLLDGNLEGAYPAHVGDVDLDGDSDILAAGYLADTFVWYENDGNGSFTRHDIDTAADGGHSIVTGDMDQDGDIDLLTSSQDANNIAWYENDGGNNFTRHIIDTSATGAKRAEFADVDGDGDMDVLSASFFAREVAWHENDGSQGFTKHIITASAVGAYFVSPADVDGDGDIDVLSASQRDETIAWYENLGGGSFNEHIINSNAHGARTVIAVDLDDDGDLDAVSASVDDDTVAWYANNGIGGFTTHGVDLTTAGAYGLTTADMDNDGDLDVLSAARDAYEASIHAQIRAHYVILEVGGVVVIDDNVLLTVDLDDQPSDLVYTITDPPVLGALELNGVPISAGGMLTQEDINNGFLVYVHSGVDATRDGFSFTVQDGGENGVQPAAGTFTFIFPHSGDAVVQLALDEGYGTVAEDVSGLGNDGTLANGAVFEADSGDGSSFSVRFDGVDDRIDLGPVDVYGSGLTLATWFKADSFPGQSNDPRLISKASGLDADAHVFMLSTTLSDDSTTRLRARVRVAGTTETLVASSGDLLTGVWYHAVATYDGAMLRLYLDGVEVGSAPLSGAVDVEPLMPLSVGGQPVGAGERFFDGLLDDVRILQRALSASEITALITSIPTIK